ncbi:hypothetical protein [Microcystis phage Mwe-JY26]
MSEPMRAFVESRVSSLIASAHPGTPISFENVTFAQPKSQHYIAVHILDGDSFQANLGRKHVERTPGILQVDVAAPKDVGKVTLNQIIKTLKDGFRGLQAPLVPRGSVSFRSPSSRRLGNEGAWFVVAMSVPYHRDEPVEVAVL